MSEWQPIETDTNDGRCVLVWWPSIDPFFPMIAWQKHGRWRSDDVVSYTIGPTYWMPLPDPPIASPEPVPAVDSAAGVREG